MWNKIYSQQISQKNNENRFWDERMACTKLDLINYDGLTTELDTPSVQKAKETNSKSIIDFTESKIWKIPFNKYLSDYYKWNRESNVNWTERNSNKKLSSNQSAKNILELKNSQDRNNTLVLNSKDAEAYNKISLEVDQFMAEANKSNISKIDFCLFVELLENMGFISKQNKISSDNLSPPLRNTK